MRAPFLIALLGLVPSVGLAQQGGVSTAADEDVPTAEPSDVARERVPAPDASVAAQPQLPQIAGVESAAIDSQHPTPGEPFYAAWWFWTGIGVFVAGIALAIAIDLTTDDPAPTTIGTTVTPLRF